MKHSKSTKAIALLMSMTMITSVFVGNTLSRYVTSVSSTDSARVAVWGINAGEDTVMNLFDTKYLVDDKEIAKANDNGDGTFDKIMAPGTSGEAPFSIINFEQNVAPEVAYEVKITFDDSAIDEKIKNNPSVQWKLDNGSFGTWDELKTAILSLSGNAAGRHIYAPGKFATAFQGTQEHKIAWQWLMDNSNNVMDTEMGNLALTNDLNAVIKVSITAQQIDDLVTNEYILDGADQIVNLNDIEPITIRSSADFSTFQGVEVNGQPLTRDVDYTATEGSTVITLNEEYLFNLAVGTYTIDIISNDVIATTKFNVINDLDIFDVKNVYDDSLYIYGLQTDSWDDNHYVKMVDTNTSNVRSIVYPLKKGKFYELKFPNEMQRLYAVVVDSDPSNLEVNQNLLASSFLQGSFSSPTEEERKPLLYIPQKDGEYLVIYTGWTENVPVYIGEHTIVAASDTIGPWYTSPIVGDLYGNDNSYGDFNWNSEEVINNLYEPMRLSNPEYITRTNIGKDQSGLYDMYSYIFEPEQYEQTIFITSGVHGSEEEAYFALANFMQQVVNEDGSDEVLHYLKENVRFIIIPIVNVWTSYEPHSINYTYERRYNSTRTDLNRDYEDQSQQEVKNVISVLEEYKDSITFAIDFHTSIEDPQSDLYYQFPIIAENAETNIKTVNHMYHVLLNNGYITELRGLRSPCDPGNSKGSAIQGEYGNSKFLPNYIWNTYKIPSMTIEHLNKQNDSLFPTKYSSESMTLAVEAYGNFIIQNALYFAK